MSTRQHKLFKKSRHANRLYLENTDGMRRPRTFRIRYGGKNPVASISVLSRVAFWEQSCRVVELSLAARFLRLTCPARRKT